MAPPKIRVGVMFREESSSDDSTSDDEESEKVHNELNTELNTQLAQQIFSGGPQVVSWFLKFINVIYFRQQNKCQVRRRRDRRK
jgi:hypothetical protein